MSKTLVHSWVKTVNPDTGVYVTTHAASAFDGRSIFDFHVQLLADLDSAILLHAEVLVTADTCLYTLHVDHGTLTFAIYVIPDGASNSTETADASIKAPTPQRKTPESAITPDAVARAKATRDLFSGDAATGQVPAVSAFNPNPLFDSVAKGN